MLDSIFVRNSNSIIPNETVFGSGYIFTKITSPSVYLIVTVTESVYSFAVDGDIPKNSIVGVGLNSIFSFLQADAKKKIKKNKSSLLYIEGIHCFVIID